MSGSAKLFPGVGRSNVAFLEYDNVERYGNYTRLHDETRSYTNIEELQYAGRIACTLKDRGIGPGDRVLAVMPNSPELTATFQAVWTIGAVMVPVNAQWSVAELTYALNNSGAVAAVASPGGFMPTTLPISAACQGCHDDMATASHALANTSALGESCATCHGMNGEFAVDKVHARTQ